MTVAPSSRGGPIIWPLAVKLNPAFAAQQRPRYTGGLPIPRRVVNLPWNAVGPALRDAPSEPRVVHQLFPLIGWSAPISAATGLTEADDTVVAVATLALAAAFAVTEGDDTLASAATLALAAALAGTEAADTVSATAALAIAGAAAITEANDTAAATATLAIAALLALAVTEADDVLVSTATIADFILKKRRGLPFLESVGRLKTM